MPEKSNILYLEPYVHILTNGSKLMLYNTLDGNTLVCRDKSIIYDLVKELESDRNLYVVELTDELIENKEVCDFIESLRSFFMGDVISNNNHSFKPVQLMPILNINNDVEKLKEVNPEAIGNDLMTYLHEITFYINSDRKQKDDIFRKAYKQFIFPYQNSSLNHLDYWKIEKVFDEINLNYLHAINIVGGKILLHPEFKQIVELIENFKIQQNYHFYYSDLIENTGNGDLRGFNIKFLKSHTINRNIHIHLDGGITENDCKKLLLFMESINYAPILHFTISSETEYNRIDKLFAENSSVKNYTFHPYFNDKNLSFFRKNVFFNRKDIFDTKQDHKDIFAKESINQIDHGKITIMNDGLIYANVNHKPIGNINNGSISDALYNEVYNGNSWRNTRGKIHPCQSCIYNSLCPPISNYEYVIGQNNLCNINPN